MISYLDNIDWQDERDFFTDYYLYLTENSITIAIKAYFADYYPYPTASSRISTCNIYQ